MNGWRDWVGRCAYLALAVLILGGNTGTALAAQQSSTLLSSPPNTAGINIQISPLPIELSAKPGTNTGSDIRVRNAGSSDENLKVVLKIFSEEGPNGNVSLRDPGPNDEVVHWVSFDKNTFNAPAGLWQTVHMTVNVPKSAAFGYYYAVQFQLANSPKPQPGSAGLQGAVAIFVLLNAEAPGEIKKAQVTSFTADHRSYEFLPASFTVRVHNSGNLHVAPAGNIFIKRGSKKIGEIDVNKTQGNVLPNSNRIFTSSWSDGFPVYQTVLDDSGQPVLDQKGKPKKTLKWDFSKANHLRFGHYTANLLLVYNNGQRDVPITGSVGFWVIPWRVLAVFLVALILVLAGLWVIFGRTIIKLIKKIKRRRPKKE